MSVCAEHATTENEHRRNGSLLSSLVLQFSLQTRPNPTCFICDNPNSVNYRAFMSNSEYCPVVVAEKISSNEKNYPILPLYDWLFNGFITELKS